jgi:hypothetical protein
VNLLLPMLESALQRVPDGAAYDVLRQSYVILMGSLAKHLDKDNPKIRPIISNLISALSTPSQQVTDRLRTPNFIRFRVDCSKIL